MTSILIGASRNLQTKPHGHGDVHALLHSSGLAAGWAAAGVKWVCFFQDTNGLVFRALPAALGAYPNASSGFQGFWPPGSPPVPRPCATSVFKFLRASELTRLPQLQTTRLSSASAAPPMLLRCDAVSS